MPDKVGELLVKNKLITKEQLEHVLRVKTRTSKRLGVILVEEKILTGKQVVENLYSQLAARINTVLQPTAEAKVLLSAFYMLCAKAQPERVEFWNGISRDQLRHAANLGEMIEIIYKRPHLFKEGRDFKEAAIETFTDGVNTHIERLMKGELPEANLIYMARDFESALIETRYAEAIISEDAAFTALIEEIKKQDEGHKQKFIKLIRDVERNKS